MAKKADHKLTPNVTRSQLELLEIPELVRLRDEINELINDKFISKYLKDLEVAYA